MRWLWDVFDFVRLMHRRLRFGELSRAPLRLVRVEWCGASVKTDWIARPADPWDADLSEGVRERNITEQALLDALQMRALLFSVFSDIADAGCRVYRAKEGGARELIIAGTVSRSDVPSISGVSSLAMRAKLCGLRFCMTEGRLEALQTQD